MKKIVLAPNMLSIIIVNWNAGKQLQDCLLSIKLVSSTCRVQPEIIIVDNASVDDSISYIDSLELPIRTIRNSENYGFAAACNQGAEESSGKYLLFLNPDAQLGNNSLSTPVDFLENASNSKVGICGIQLIDESGNVSRSCARFPSIFNFIAQGTGLSKLPFLRSLGVHMLDWDHSTSRFVDHVIGAFYIVRRDIFRSLKGFDEDFFVYLEDLDFSLRASQAGWRCCYLADAQAFHKGGGTSEQVKGARLFYSLRSRILYSFKHFNNWSATCLTLCTIFVEPLFRSLFFLSKVSFRDIKDTIEAYFRLLFDLPTLFLRIYRNYDSKSGKHNP
jgi:N-acetylglucosaminyl-diphospho-decaprenol L-rhamnosyltransferase